MKNYPANNDYVKTDNLNSKTVEIMKNSPGVGNSFYNQNIGNNFQTNQKALIKVNINNSNRIDKSDFTEYEKSLFKANALNSRENTACMMSSSTNNTTTNPHCQKRNYYQISEIENKNNSYLNYQTPMASDMYKTNKKFKYN